jgi:hypothetical protein
LKTARTRSSPRGISKGIEQDSGGRLDEQQTFPHINYPALLLRQRLQNVPQKSLSPQPIDFVAMILPDRRSYWPYGGDLRQLIIDTKQAGQLRLRPVKNLCQKDAGEPLEMEDIPWHSGLPLALFEDENLHVPAGVDKADWRSQWHSEREWLQAINACRYSKA